MKGRLGNLAATLAVAAAAAGPSVFRSSFGQSADKGPLARRREEKRQERLARREGALAKAEAKRNAKNAKRRVSMYGR